MTIAITLKVNDGVVIASDSATTMAIGPTEANVYNNADKISNLHKGTPVGAVVFGMGNIGPASLATLMKDLRKRFAESPDEKQRLDPASYTVEWVAARLKDFLFDEHYRPFLEGVPDLEKEKWPYLGALVAGYSAGAATSEVWRITLAGGAAKLEINASPNDAAMINWGGDAEAIHRLILGFDYRLPKLVADELQLDANKVKETIVSVANKIEPVVLPSAMPIQDVIELGHFLVDLSAKYSRYTPGHQTIGGPIEIAAITKHEGFKWVRRKHYYDANHNPK